MYRLMMETEQIQCEGQAVRCRIWSLQHKYMQNDTQRGKQNSISKIINGMPLTFVLVYREDAMFARSIGENVIIFNNNLV